MGDVLFYHIIDELKSSSNAIIIRKYLLDGLEKIKTRGYDGAGIATMSPRQGQMVRYDPWGPSSRLGICLI